MNNLHRVIENICEYPLIKAVHERKLREAVHRQMLIHGEKQRNINKKDEDENKTNTKIH